jgi:hypothetical protein
MTFHSYLSHGSDYVAQRRITMDVHMVGISRRASLPNSSESIPDSAAAYPPFRRRRRRRLLAIKSTKGGP